MDVTVSYVVIRIIFGLIVCPGFAYLQYKYRHVNFLPILSGFFIGGSIYCFIVSNELLYIAITAYFSFSSLFVGAIRMFRFIKTYKNQQSNENNITK